VKKATLASGDRLRVGRVELKVARGKQASQKSEVRS
jgi:hypothetical protein